MTTEAGVGGGVPRFDVVLRGYDRRQVDEHVSRLQRAIVRMRSDLDIVRSQPLSAVGRPSPVARPGMPPDGGPDAQAIVAKAEEEAAEIRNRARSAARAEEERVKAQLVDLTRQRDALLAEISRLRGQRDGAQREAPVAAPTSRMSSPSDAPPGSPGTPPRTRDGGQGGSTPGMDSPDRRPSGPPARPGAGAQAPAARAGGPGQGGPGGPGPQGGQGGPGRPGQAPAGPNRPPQVADPTVAARANAPKAPGAPGAGPMSSPHHQVPGGQQQPPSRPVEPGRSGPGGPGGPPGPKGGAAHRLPSGGFPAVDKAPSSMRPRGEPDPDVGELFRPKDGAQPGGPQRPGGNPTQDPTAMVRAAEPRGAAPARPADPTRSVDPPPKTGQHGPGRGPGAPAGGPGQPKNGQPGGNQPAGQGRPGGPGGPGGQGGQNGQGGQGRPAGPDATVLAAAQQQKQGQQKPGDPKQGRPDDKGERPNGPDRAGRSPSGSRSG